MRIFEVRRGTAGYVIANGEMKPWVTRKPLAFEREDIVIDPVSLANGREVEGVVKTLAEIGYAVFKRGKYALAVRSSRVRVI